MKTDLNKKENLIYLLLFSKKLEFNINIEEYCNTESRSDFREDVRNAIKRGNVFIVDDTIIHTEEKIIWKIILKRENGVVKKLK